MPLGVVSKKDTYKKGQKIHSNYLSCSNHTSMRSTKAHLHMML
jgi:hypothetical protein